MSQSTTWNPESYARDARFVSDLGEPLLEILDPQPGEIILDLGCGDGRLAEKIAARSNVVGVDSSMIDAKSVQATPTSAYFDNSYVTELKQSGFLDGIWK